MKFYLLVLISFFLFSCKKTEALPDSFGLNFYFENLQPINDSELREFPNKFIGLFMDKDSSFVKIEDKKILIENYRIYKIHKMHLDSLKEFFSYSNGKLKNLTTNKTSETIVRRDSIEVIEKNIDTIFIFSNSQKAKLISGQLVLNTKDSIFWKIRLISLEKDVLKIKYIYSKEDLIRLDSITEEKPKMINSSSFIVRPTRREFKSILNLKHFGEDRRYKKVSDSKIRILHSKI